MMTEEQIVARLLAGRLDKPPAPKPKPATVLTVASDHKLSVEGQRERVTREMQELIDAEKNRQSDVRVAPLFPSRRSQLRNRG